MLRKGRQNAGAGFHQQNAEMVGLKVAKVLADHEASELRNGAGHFDAAGAAANNDARQQRLLFGGAVRSFGLLKRQKKAMPDLPRLVDRLETRRQSLPLV